MTTSLVLAPLAQHMGQLHAYENYLVLAIAFGPFLVLGLVVFVVRRRDLAEDDDGARPTAREAKEPGADTGVSPGRPPTT
ncbi:hypothetical protein ASG90_02485 [Nocardioides sp. Soil797]|nr:hypothetical protein ASG90_02485 [Nocardioides sp. Soil797]